MNYEDTIKFLNEINRRVYGVEPFSEDDDDMAERRDEGEPTPEELQEKADELRDMIREDADYW